MRCDQVKRRTLWAGLAGTAAVATGVAIWAIQPHDTAAPESKAVSEASRTVEANALLQAARLQSQYQDPKGATRTYRRVLELDPDNKIAWYNLGVIAQQAGRTTDARSAYDEALKIDPKYPSALFNKAVLLKSSEPDRAMGLLNRAIEADPKAATAHLQLGQLLVKKGRDEEAKEAFHRAVAADPSLYTHVPEPFRNEVNPSPKSSQAGDNE